MCKLPKFLIMGKPNHLSNHIFFIKLTLHGRIDAAADGSEWHSFLVDLGEEFGNVVVVAVVQKEGDRAPTGT